MRDLVQEDSEVVVAFIAPIELESAIARRSSGREPETRRRATEIFATLEHGWSVVNVDNGILATARRHASVHGLRSGDAIQLACAGVTTRSDQQTIVTLDDELRLAARAEGFAVLP